MTEVAISTFAAEDIGSRAPRRLLAIIDLELTVGTDDDYVGETIALGYQYALKLEFARQFPDLSLLYDLRTEISGRRVGSKIYDIKVAPVLKRRFRHLVGDIEKLEESVVGLQAEAEKSRAVAAKKTLVAKILSVVAGLTTALNMGIAIHTFGEKWELIPERAKQTIEQNHPGTMIQVRQVALAEPPPEAKGEPPNGDFNL